MPETKRKPIFSLQGFDASHYQQTEAYVQAIDAIYSQALADFAQLAGSKKLDPSKQFSFKDYPGAQQKVDAIISKLSGNMQAIIEHGSEDQWLYACKKNDAFIGHILNTSKVQKATLERWQDRNLDALKTFQTRKIDGMDLSKRIWNYTGQMKTQMELGIDIALGDGKSAAALSRDLRQYLVDPDKLFRRVRDKHGSLVLSKNAAAFHPGQGKYRSSYKNAMRLTRSEINMAYRESDQLRWEKLDFVGGFEVKLSNNHTLNGVPFVDICDDLKGTYPKQFKFIGWHPQCMCHAVPILMNPDEFDTDELNELKAAINDTEYTPYVSKNTVNDVPAGFKDWIDTNAERSLGWKSQPYFIRDNFSGGKIAGGLKVAVMNAEQLAAAKAAAEAAKVTAEAAKLAAEKAAKAQVDSVADVLGIKKGAPMDFDMANEQRGNIGYENGAEYRVNCQSCVVSNELRRRGYDVTAMPNFKIKGSIPYELSKNTEKAWIDPLTGKYPEKFKAGGKIEYDKKLRVIPKKIADISKDLDNYTKPIGRYHLDVKWKKSREGHIITLERLENGNIRIYDPQNGKLVRWAELANQIDTGWGVNLLRVDNLDVNLEIIKGVVRKL